MKKLILGLVAVGSVMALRPMLKRRMVQKLREHCKEMAEQFRADGEAAETREHSEQEAPQFVGDGEAVATA